VTGVQTCALPIYVDDDEDYGYSEEYEDDDVDFIADDEDNEPV
jgi:hypothetical protein